MENYLQLLKKIDDFAAAISARYPKAVCCKAGCASCCVSGISVWRVEYDNILNHLNKNRLIRGIYTEQSRSAHNDKQSCSFLISDNLCSIYEARPLVCRVWGIPQLNEGKITCCDKNFNDDIDLPKADILNMDTVLKTLSAINHVYCKRIRTDPFARYKLNTIKNLPK